MTSPANPPVQPGRRFVLVGFCVAVLLVMILWSYGRMARSAAAAGDSMNQWTRCDVLAKQIQELRARPSMADDRVMEVSDMTRRIARAAADSSFNTKDIVSTAHPDARRIGRTPYLEKPTQLLMRGVTLKQTLEFLYALTGDGSRLNLTQLRFTAPRDENKRRQWTVEATVRYLIYKPRDNNGS